MSKHYITEAGKHFLFSPEYRNGWTWKEGAEMAQSFQTSDNEIVEWGHKYSIDRYVTIPDGPTISVQKIAKDGRGYDGGHNTAARLGWPVSHPRQDENAVLWWDATRQGRFTGYKPATVSLVLA